MFSTSVNKEITSAYVPCVYVSFLGFTKVDYTNITSNSKAIIPFYVENVEVDVLYDNNYVLPVPVREGFEFDGWYYNGTKIETIGDKWQISKNVTLVAKWK